MFINPDAASFVVGPMPSLVLVSAPGTEALPAFATTDDGQPHACDGWQLLPRMTMCVVDGPGEAGFLVPAFGAGEDWFKSVVRAGGALVLALEDGQTLADFTGSTARGGFVRLADGA